MGKRKNRKNKYKFRISYGERCKVVNGPEISYGTFRGLLKGNPTLAYFKNETRDYFEIIRVENLFSIEKDKKKLWFEC